MFLYIHIHLQFQIWTVCLLVCLFSDKTPLTKPLQRRQGLAFQMSGCTVPVLGHPLIWHEATNLLWYDIRVVSGKFPGRHNHRTLLGKPIESIGAGRVKGWVSKGKSHLQADEAGGSPMLGLCSRFNGLHTNCHHPVLDTLCTNTVTASSYMVKSI